MTTISHYWVYGGIWAMSVYDVPWFSPRDDFTQVCMQPSRKTSQYIEEPAVKSVYDVYDYDHAASPTPSTPDTLFNYCHAEAPRALRLVHHQSQETLRPTWAKNIQTRRGVDQPFALPGAKHISRMIAACIPDSRLSVPPKAQMRSYELPKLDLDFNMTPRYPSYSQFPESVHDEDKPVNAQRLSQWVRADSAGPRSV